MGCSQHGHPTSQPLITVWRFQIPRKASFGISFRSQLFQPFKQEDFTHSKPESDFGALPLF
jgi:hypothetical protein